jgi:hypothetical protein
VRRSCHLLRKLSDHFCYLRWKGACIHEGCYLGVQRHLPTYMKRIKRQDGPETYMQQIWYLISVTSFNTHQVPCESGNRVVREQDKSFQSPAAVYLLYYIPSSLPVVHRSPSKSHRCNGKSLRFNGLWRGKHSIWDFLAIKRRCWF